MTTIQHTEFRPTVKKTDESLFNMIPILKDDYDNKYILVSYEEESYLDQELIDSLMGIVNDEYDYIIDGSSYGTLYDIGYNI